jgi:hypothetical protein
MNGTIYLIDDNERLKALAETPYDSEDLLQTLLERYPALLAGDASGGAASRRWVLVAREMGVPGEDGGSGRWSLDHLFLDSEGVPTLVEVKRATDTRIRREVVGQMLDYAANGVAYWPIEEIQARLASAAEKQGRLGDDLVADLIGIEPDEVDEIAAFWMQVKSNLRAGRIRLVFVADRIPNELKRIVEFLNGQMEHAEVLAVEVRQFVGDGVRTLAPRLIGQTAEAERKKPSGARTRVYWTRDTFLKDLSERTDDQHRDLAARIIAWAEENNLLVRYGSAQKGVCGLRFPHGGKEYSIFGIWSTGGVAVRFVSFRGPLDAEEVRLAVRDRLLDIEGLDLSHHRLDGKPSFPLTALAGPGRLEQFLEVLDWIKSLIRSLERRGMQ